MSFSMSHMSDKGLESLTDSCIRFYVFAFSTAENRLCRTLVRRRDDFRRFCIFFISPRFGKAKKAQTEKALGEAKIVRTEKAKTS